MAATIITNSEAHAQTMYHVFDAAEAAAKLGRSESSIRREAKKLGVKKIKGNSVAGFIVWPHAHGALPVALSFAE